jgi:hypothetical protein
MHRRAPLLVTVAGLTLVAFAAGGCKKKPPPGPTLLTPTTTSSGFSDRCEGRASTLYDLSKVDPYALHADGRPSKAAFFRRDSKSTVPGWQGESPAKLAGWSAGMYEAMQAELTVCIDAKEPTTGETFSCSYYGAKVTVQGRNYTVKVIETATGKTLADESFATDPRVTLCPGAVTGSYTEYGDWQGHVAAIVGRFQPPAAAQKLPKPALDDLYGVCAGSGIPQAKAADEHGALKVVYFPTATTSFANEDVPSGFAMGSTNKDAAQYSYVACVTGKPATKKGSCDYLGTTSLLGIYDGTFDVELREVRTGKVVETKTFSGTSSGCPDTYKFKGTNDQRIMKIEPAYRTWIQSVAER